MLAAALDAWLACLPGCRLRLLACTTALAAVNIQGVGRLAMHALERHPRRPALVRRMVAEYRKHGFPVDEAEVWWLYCSFYAIALQHLAAGAFLLAATLADGGGGGGASPAAERARALAILGVLTEVGYELYDSAYYAYRQFVRRDLPGGLLAFCLIMSHHQLSLSLALPLTAGAPSAAEGALRSFAATLTLTGAGGMFLTAYAQLQDATTAAGRARASAAYLLHWAVTLYGRALFYGPAALAIVAALRADGAYCAGARWWCAAPVAASLGGMCLFNAWMLYDSTSKLAKFALSPPSRFLREAAADAAERDDEPPPPRARGRGGDDGGGGGGGHEKPKAS